jgi:aspartyl-tRNA(Asn)/glutamyl-tRNA(Gln) amidotransferase subunit A
VYGLLTTTVADSARHLDVTAGPHELDRLSLPAPTVGYEAAIESLEVAGLKARWSPDLGFAKADPEVLHHAEAAARDLASAAGLRLDDEPVHLPDAVKVWMSAGAMDLWLDLEPGMWPDRADDLTAFSADGLRQTEDWVISRFANVKKRREDLTVHAAALFDEVDVVLTPTTAIPAFDADGPPLKVVDGEEIFGAMATPYTMLANLCWNPAISVPAGLTDDGLPIGLQIIARRHHDEIPLRLARILEQTRPWPRLAPS